MKGKIIFESKFQQLEYLKKQINKMMQYTDFIFNEDNPYYYDFHRAIKNNDDAKELIYILQHILWSIN